ncbi:hypothetical protein AAFF_G00262290 [Aldrovandia affinis]|uniref:Uncharacterized protein n=1 Tax=Aldrovandia affinis TaxID=143900 RepID=A0AAD7SSR6_9TELE|nr:hypothetical protein AAFF_G00262290 [Aldrovandia affinis]
MAAHVGLQLQAELHFVGQADPQHSSWQLRVVAHWPMLALPVPLLSPELAPLALLRHLVGSWGHRAGGNPAGAGVLPQNHSEELLKPWGLAGPSVLGLFDINGGEATPLLWKCP